MNIAYLMGVLYNIEGITETMILFVYDFGFMWREDFYFYKGSFLIIVVKILSLHFDACGNSLTGLQLSSDLRIY